MKIVNVHRAKTQLSKLLEGAEAGEDIVIARAGVPVVRLVRVRAAERQPGRLEGLIRLSDDFDTPLPSALAGPFGSTDSSDLPDA
jgi:prevent-host-death family protein